MKYKKFAMGLLLLAGCQIAQAEQIGSVDTVFKCNSRPIANFLYFILLPLLKNIAK
jgi:catabolite regulation protein CreA